MLILMYVDEHYKTVIWRKDTNGFGDKAILTLQAQCASITAFETHSTHREFTGLRIVPKESISAYLRRFGAASEQEANCGIYCFVVTICQHKSRPILMRAEPLYVRSLEIRERQLGEDHPDVAQSLSNLALLYYSQGKYSEAEPLYVRSLEIRERQLGTDHPDVAQSLNNLATLYQTQGKYSEAEPLLVRSLDIKERQLGADHPDVATSLNNLAELYRSQGKYSEAEPLYLRSLAAGGLNWFQR